MIVDEIVTADAVESEMDWYVREAYDANSDAGYFPSNGTPPQLYSPPPIHYCLIPWHQLKQSMRRTTAELSDPLLRDVAFTQAGSDPTNIHPTVFLSDDAEIERAIISIITQFALKPTQEFAFRIIADQSLR